MNGSVIVRAAFYGIQSSLWLFIEVHSFESIMQTLYTHISIYSQVNNSILFFHVAVNLSKHLSLYIVYIIVYPFISMSVSFYVFFRVAVKLSVHSCLYKSIRSFGGL